MSHLIVMQYSNQSINQSISLPAPEATLHVTWDLMRD